jgi:transcriptional regulator with XRE-family HTH domain
MVTFAMTALPTARSRTASNPELGERLRALRIAAGFSQVRLAARADVGLQTIGLAERAGLLSEATAAKLASALGCAPEDLKPTDGGRP